MNVLNYFDQKKKQQARLAGFNEFLDKCCSFGPSLRTKGTILFEEYSRRYPTDLDPITMGEFYIRLDTLKDVIKCNGYRGALFLGIALKPNLEEAISTLTSLQISKAKKKIRFLDSEIRRLGELHEAGKGGHEFWQTCLANITEQLERAKRARLEQIKLLKDGGYIYSEE